jgi:hypothetical protein
MGNWRDALPSQWLKATDFEKPALLTIKKFSVEALGEDKRPVLWFNESEKGLVLNITNGTTVEEICGSADTAKWVGHKVVAFQTMTDYGGKRVPCIRVRAPKPGAVPPTPPPDEFQADDEDVPF